MIQQTERRVLHGESVPAAEKIVSIFEPHTDTHRTLLDWRPVILLGYKAVKEIDAKPLRFGGRGQARARSKYWAATRARLVEGELALPLGHITVPPTDGGRATESPVP